MAPTDQLCASGAGSQQHRDVPSPRGSAKSMPCAQLPAEGQFKAPLTLLSPALGTSGGITGRVVIVNHTKEKDRTLCQDGAPALGADIVLFDQP